MANKWQIYTDHQPDERFSDECEAFQWDNHATFTEDGAQVYIEKDDWVVRYRLVSQAEAEKEKPKDERKASKGWYYTGYTDAVFTARFTLGKKPKVR